MKLYPPYIEGKIPAFIKDNSKTNIEITIPFQLNPLVGINEVTKMRLVIRTLSGTQVGSPLDTENFCYGEKDGKAVFVLSNKSLVTIGQFYKVQLAFIQNTSEGYYSSVGIIKCLGVPSVAIDGLVSDVVTANLKNFTFTYSYSPKVANSDVILDNEKIYSYKFDIYDNYQELFESSGDLIHNVNLNSNSNSWMPHKSLIPDKIYYIQCTITTQNSYECKSEKYPIMEGICENVNTQYNNFDLNDTNNPPAYWDQEQGCVKISIRSNDIVNGQYKIVRASSQDNYATWVDIFDFAISNNIISLVNKGRAIEWNDYFLEHGISYHYGLQRYNSHGTRLEKIIITKKPILAEFEDMFLYDGTRQLRIAFNPKVSSFKTTILETKTDTLGGAYPFFYRNGNIAYKDFQISGLFSMHMDTNLAFFGEKKLKQILNLKDEEFAPQRSDKRRFKNNPNGDRYTGGTPTDLLLEHYLSTNLSTKTIYLETLFKEEVTQWLNNGKPKLFRSPTEGNYLIRLMNISLTPNDTLNRMINTFNANAYEIGKSDIISLLNNEQFKPQAQRLNIISMKDQVITNLSTALPQEYYEEIEIFGCTKPNIKNQNNNFKIPVNSAFNYYLWKDLESADTYSITLDEKYSNELGRTFYNTKVRKGFEMIGEEVDTFEALLPTTLSYATGTDPNADNGYLVQSVGVSGLGEGGFGKVTIEGRDTPVYLQNGYTLIGARLKDCRFEVPENTVLTFYYYKKNTRGEE